MPCFICYDCAREANYLLVPYYAWIRPLRITNYDLAVIEKDLTFASMKGKGKFEIATRSFPVVRFSIFFFCALILINSYCRTD